MKSIKELAEEFKKRAEGAKDNWSHGANILWSIVYEEIADYLSKNPTKEEALIWLKENAKAYKEMAISSAYVWAWKALADSGEETKEEV